ncbi:hypothetical protein TRL7639_01234 [Falsiruegeria litorea R37]|uniref:Sulfotransferase domain protein n=1 Tax=Falsiruegeria litorea R37 TaxID=1200284 RepID=A0A1Y5S0Y9_9RHOB|nr:hypothetical protein [Falsiruegeria litorea]SLN30147.1 hypothetical protein TRL7639_01234 [Falsiruegeria litorea R37]
MQIILHTGAHATDDERLLKCMLYNKEALGQRGIAVPGPGKYRSLLKDAFAAMETAEPSGEARDILVDAILDEEVADRLLLSNAHFFGSQRFALDGDTLYPLADVRLRQLRELFKFDQLEIFMAIRNPAAFVPAILAKASPARIKDVMENTNPLNLRWSELFQRMRAAAPDIPITVWCNEDTPLLWGQIMRDFAGLEHGTKVTGGFSLLSEIMSNEGMTRFRGYLHQHPELTEMQKRRVIAAFLDKYAIEDEVEEELDLDGWTDELVDELTEIYDEDVLAVQRIPGVTLIAP